MFQTPLSIFRYQEEETISTFDLMQLSLSALLLTHSLINFHTAKTIIHEAKAETLAKFEHQLEARKPRTTYDHVKNTLVKMRPKPFKRRRTIRSIRQIDDSREFFHKTYEFTKKTKVEGTKGIKLEDNGDLVIDDRKFSASSLEKLTQAERAAVLAYVNSLTEGKITETIVADKLEAWCEAHNESDERFKKILEKIPSFQGKTARLSPSHFKSHLFIFARIFQNTPEDSVIQPVMNFAAEISENIGFRSPNSFLQIVADVNHFVIRQACERNQKTSDILEEMAEFNSLLLGKLRQRVIHQYLRQMNDPNAQFLWTYSSPEKAKVDYETYKRVMDLCKKEPLPLRDWWEELQKFFADDPKGIEDVDEGTRHLSFNNGKYKGKVLIKLNDGEIVNREILHFHRIKP